MALLFLALHIFASHGHGSPLPPTYDGSICSESLSAAASTSAIRSLSSATKETANYTSYSCGYTDLKMSCQDEGETTTPIIQLGGDNYTVPRISYNNYTITVADTDAVRDGNGCPRVRHNVTFGTEWLHYTGYSDNLTFFFGCYSTSSDRGPPPNLAMDRYQINCAGFEPPGSGVSFVFASEEHELPQEHELAGHCSQVFVAPVQRDFLLMSSNQSMASGGYGNVLKQGFELASNRNTTDRFHPAMSLTDGAPTARTGIS